ncbi:transglutaminase superfamily protein [Ulvibacter sp. MAR_2010_11]|uniref:transglutaminase domain-containing protein n=1 Tax=Ulvibacter sp. MAR_2010_11 TaxID=1250229 RepID=UPI000C2C3362|nr:transglutaminase domain-containing protein [Ulvibacter sp. MAR_2010_11]PKA82584.1 transglutaminase superfamily protein [Ulvibacter sp. MAR_2010_11]
MIKQFTYLLLFLIGVTPLIGFSQDYERIDATILLYPKTFEKAEDLSKFISRDFTTDEEKVRAMYSWIIQNIAYEPDEYKQFDFKFKNYRERNQKEEKTREKVISRTLQKGIAVCEGYAMLFEKLCELQGIQNYLVRGDTKTNFNDIGRSFAKNHMWNVVYIDEEPYLFDLTWGAGRYNGKFIKEPSYFYYKTAPGLFFKTHYPEMLEDAYIDNIVTREVFSTMPLIISERLKIEDVEVPLNGIIRAEDYFDSVAFTINNASPSSVSYSYGKEKIKLESFEKSQGRAKFSIPLELGVENLLIYFDDEPVLGYKIK